MYQESEENAKRRAYLRRRIENDFAYHRCNPDQQLRMGMVRDHANTLARCIVDNLPLGREMDTALSLLEQVSTCANSGIAREVAPNEN